MLNPQTLQDRREQKQEDRKELFAQRYEGLLAWALRLTNHHRASAEDLVQDAFIQFVLGRTSIEEIENVDGYLRRMLRYMHLSRMTHNTGLERTLSINDYDSFDQGLRALEPSRYLQAKEELFKICSYACARKETSRAGSVLLLRFFHEYYPSEIAKVLCSSRNCVDQWQKVARNELKAYLNGQGGLRLFPPKTSNLVIPKLSTLNGDLIAELRQMIFRSCQGICIPTELLREIYKSGNQESLNVTRLAHLVSCRKCLDEVNRLLDLPLLPERCDDSSKSADEPPHNNNGNGSSGGGPSDLGIKCQKRLRDVVEHKPQELRIVVNGNPVSSLKINSDLNELSLNLAEQEAIEFVEVLSEQNLQLMFFSVGDAASSGTDQWATIELSDERTLEARLQPEKTLRIVYREPVRSDAPEPLTLIQNISSSVSVTDNNADSGRIHDRWEDNFRSTLKRIWKLFRSKFAGDGDFTELTLFGRVSPVPSRPLWSSLLLITPFILIAISIGAYLFLRTDVTSAPTATHLLALANQAEEQITRSPEVATHQVIGLEERNSSGALVARHKIEAWENSEGSFAQRLYDEGDHILAGTWQKADGSRAVYHHRSGSRLHTMPIKPDSLLLNLEDVWQVRLSVKEFKALVAATEQGVVIEQPSNYVVTFSNERVIGATRLRKATLTLNRANLRAIEQTLLIERGNEVREYRFVEATFERLTLKDVPTRVFEPDAILERRAAIAKRSDVIAFRSIVPHNLPSLSAAASAELEVDVAYLLNQAKADRHEQISVSRTADGLLLVEGVVDTEQRKNDFIRALSAVSNNPLVKIKIATVTDALQQQRRSSPGASVREVEETVNMIAVDRELRNYLSGTNEISRTGADLDEAARSFSSKTVNRAYRMLLHAIELKGLMNRFAKVDMRTVTPDARAKWLRMVHEHAAAFERETIILRQELQPLFAFSIGSTSTSGGGDISNDADLAQTVEQIHKLALQNSDAIRSAFTISSQSSSAAIKSPQFWRGLTIAGALAARVKEYNR